MNSNLETLPSSKSNNCTPHDLLNNSNPILQNKINEQQLKSDKDKEKKDIIKSLRDRINLKRLDQYIYLTELFY